MLAPAFWEFGLKPLGEIGVEIERDLLAPDRIGGGLLEIVR